ncbi:SurA N-terminal domain-containing protein [Silanimonas sp.]|jgi:peptidyl-prolyl cis-trans isomerase D|uniref:SurA N-terminal domain-containing protein n=1 Tax=Silanimonas sp. TaxID=1929290 RepID=UPI0037CC6CA2
MLQRIREHTSGWFAWVVIGLIIFAMAFFGIEQYFQTRIDTYSAKIESPPTWWRDAPSDGATGRLARAFVWDSVEISQAEFRERFDRYREQVRAQAGDAYDAEQVESIETKRLVLDGLVDEKILEIAAQRDGVAVDASQIRKAILEIDGITQDGEFIGEDAYKIWLQSRGLTAAGFEALIARQLTTSTLPNAVAESGLVGDAELENLLKLQQETRDLRFVEIPPPALPADATNDAALAEWHSANAERYSTEETVTISYLELDAASIAVASEPTEQDLRDRYESEKGRFGTEEERVAAHILIAVPADADDAAIEAARSKAVGIAEQARAESADFAALAAANSEDLGTKDLGGDLGTIGKDVFPKPFEEAVFALSEGGVSDPVRTDQGWHVIKLTQLVAGSQQPFEAVRDQLAAEFGESERERLFNEKSGTLVDAILREPNSLPAVARAMDVEVKTTEPFTRAAGDSVAAIEAVRAAAYSRSQKDDRLVSDPIEIGPNQVVVLQVTEHAPSALRPLAEVRDQVQADLQADRLATAARERAEALLERARKGETLDALATEIGVVPQDSNGVARQAGFPDPAIATEAFRLLPIEAGKPSDVGLAELSGGRFALVVATKVTPGDTSTLTPDVRSQIRAQLAQMRGDMERQAFVKALRGQFEIKVAEERL